MKEIKKQRILTGDRPTGKLHIGHYFGSLQNRVKLQDEYETFILVADLQALTDNFSNPEKVAQNIYETTLDNLAAGLNPEKCTFVVQSMVPELAELTMFYSNLVTVSRLQRNPTIKTEIGQKKELFGSEGESVTYGFLGYPISQAADITAFEAEAVPVGEDQLPLIEQTKEIVRKFNSLFKEVLIEPEAVISEHKRIKGLDGNAKMGKSLGNSIYLSDNEETIRLKIKGAITDTNKIHKNDPANPEICMVGYYHKLFNKDNLETVYSECRKGERGCVSCKKELADNIILYLKPIQERRKYYEERPELVKKILIEGTKKARLITKNTVKKVKEAMKINYFDE
ncbi:MAG: tryptophan--tRNA ligase [Clostridia bacterium]|nr:tryptophan--tRNA ligase [Clostridia bacterium]MDD4375683.1 tryptophan--tRNA ligase [Clostridia bacterium]